MSITFHISDPAEPTSWELRCWNFDRLDDLPVVVGDRAAAERAADEHASSCVDCLTEGRPIIDGVYDVEEGRRELAAAQTQAKYEAMPGKDLEKELKLLEKQMLDAAKNLEFEKAATLRDKLYKLKERLFGVALPTET